MMGLSFLYSHSHIGSPRNTVIMMPSAVDSTLLVAA